MDAKQQPLGSYFTDQLWRNNQVLVAILGICSALAVTINVNTALAMGLAVTFVTGCSSALVSMLRYHTPDSVRMITQLAIISMFVTVVDLILNAYAYDIAKTLSVFVGLIITNYLVMGRAEAMARHVSPLPAFLDGFAAGLGYAIVLLIVGIVREILGSGTLMGFTIIPHSWYATSAHPDRYSNFNIMVLAPGAFFILGAMIAVVNMVNKDETAS